MPIKAFTHEGVDVIFTDDHRFTFEGARGIYDSGREATEAIEAQVKRQAALSKKKLSLPVIGNDGVERTITGVHARNGSLLVSPKLADTYNASALYPNTSTLAPLVKQLFEAEREAKALRQRLERAALKWWNSDGLNNKDPLDLLERQYKDACAAGEKL